jgi:RNA polymerase sigma-54 factor
MKPSLQLQIGQQLTMTPQLQQAIRLLQLSTLDLRQEIQQAVESNPLLELADDFGDESLPDADEERQDEQELDTERDDALEEFVDDEPGIETEWDDVIPARPAAPPAPSPTMPTTGNNAIALPAIFRTTCSGN